MHIGHMIIRIILKTKRGVFVIIKFDNDLVLRLSKTNRNVNNIWNDKIPYTSFLLGSCALWGVLNIWYSVDFRENGDEIWNWWLYSWIFYALYRYNQLVLGSIKNFEVSK